MIVSGSLINSLSIYLKNVVGVNATVLLSEHSVETE